MTQMRSSRLVQITTILVTIVSVFAMTFASTSNVSAKGENPPVCHFELETNVNGANALVRFDASESHATGNKYLTKYNWEVLPGGQKMGGVYPDLTFTEGKYTVTLLCVDNKGEYSTYTLHIEVIGTEVIDLTDPTVPVATPTPQPEGNSSNTEADYRLLELFFWVVLAGILLAALVVVLIVRVLIAVFNFIVDMVNAVLDFMTAVIDAIGEILEQVIKVVAAAIGVLIGITLVLLGVGTFLAVAFLAAVLTALFVIAMGPTIVALVKIAVIAGLVFLLIVGVFVIAFLWIASILMLRS